MLKDPNSEWKVKNLEVWRRERRNHQLQVKSKHQSDEVRNKKEDPLPELIRDFQIEALLKGKPKRE